MEIVYRRPASQPRTAQVRRLVLPQYPHYVLLRCSTGRNLFPTMKVAVDYLTRLREIARDHGVGVHAYTLLQQQIHLAVTPASPTSLSLILGRLNGSFARRTLQAQGSGSHQLFMKPLTMAVHPEHAIGAIRWVERLYLEAAAYEAGDPVVSSYASRANGTHDMFLTSSWPGSEPMDGPDWRAFVALFPAEDEQAILTRIGSGYPWGPADWVKELESRYGKRLHPIRSHGLDLSEGVKTRSLEAGSLVPAY